jgi:methyltransferase (TIGR00027 family)
MGMKRSDDDSWDLTTSVGVTATMVAAARAAASRQQHPIIRDPLAEPLVRAAGVELFTRLASGDLEFSDVGTGWMPDFFGVRASFFDGFFPSVLPAGIRQAVIVASGLDSRAYRLQWPAGTVLYEIDQPGVIAFKNAVLSQLDVKPATEVHAVAADLRHDWPMLLRQSGFDPAKPTAWMLEGLMIGYLPGDAQNRMLDQITALSAPGSQLVADHLLANSTSVGSHIAEAAAAWRQQGFDVDFGNLTYSHERNDAEGYLRARGWKTIDHHLTDLLRAAGVPAGDMDTGPNGHGGIHYLTATRNGHDD